MRALLFHAVLGMSSLSLFLSLPLIGYGPTAPGAETPMDRPVRIDVRAPAGADIWFEEVKTLQGGSFRQFLSPPLTPGRGYNYEMRVRWLEGARPVEQTRRLTVYAGDRIAIDFYGPNSGEPRASNDVFLSAGPGSTQTRAYYYAPVSPGQDSTETPAYYPVGFPEAGPPWGYYLGYPASYSSGQGQGRFYERSESPVGPPGFYHSTWDP